MRTTRSALSILTTLTYRGVGRAWIRKHLRGGEAPDVIVSLLNQNAREERLVSVGEFEQRRDAIHAKLRNLAGTDDGVVALGDPAFPSSRGRPPPGDQPVVLFYRGDLRLLSNQNRNVALIGLREPTEETARFERRIVAKLVSHGVTIVSGLALGCDTVAHEQALESNGKTVAILPSPLADVLPRQNQNLAGRIVQHDGLLLSEYYDSASSRMVLSGRYLERDRLQALFSDCVLLTASYAQNDSGNDSGARHAMTYAARYSISRAVVYDAALHERNPHYDLNRQLMAEDGKVIVVNAGNLQSALTEILSPRALATRTRAEQEGLFR